MIRAECHSDDMAASAKFDATPWFEAADDQDIVDLADISWGGDYDADRVAQFLEGKPGYAAVDAVLDHARDAKGFEVHVHGPDALAWVRENRPEAFSALVITLALTDPLPSTSEPPSWEGDSSWGGEYAVPEAGTPSP